MKSRLKLIAPSKAGMNRPASGCLFRYSFGNSFVRWGRIVDRCVMGEDSGDLHLACFYSVASEDARGVPQELIGASWDARLFALPPLITNEKPWRAGVFVTDTEQCVKFDLSKVCVKSPVTAAMFTLDGAPIAAARPHVGVRSLFGIAYIEDLLLEAAAKGAWSGDGMLRLMG